MAMLVLEDFSEQLTSLLSWGPVEVGGRTPADKMKCPCGHLGTWLAGGISLVPGPLPWQVPLVEQANLLGYAQYRVSCLYREEVVQRTPQAVDQSFQCDGGWGTVVMWPFSPSLQ